MTFRVMIDFGNAPAKTGIGVFARGLLNAVRTSTMSDFEVCEAGISSTSNSLRPARRLVYLARLVKMRKREFDNAQVVHFVNQFVPKRTAKVAYAFTSHDLDPILVSQEYAKRYSTYFRKTITKAVERAHLIETHTESVKEDVVSYFDLDPGRFRVIGDGLAQDFIDLADRIPSVRPEVPTLLFVGQINRKKNVLWLVRTFVRGVRNGALPKMRLVLAGSPGYGYREVEDEVSSVHELVEWKRSPAFSEIVKLYRGASSLVLPSIREGFGRPLLEAMYCDIPIVASRIPSSVEVAREAAQYFALADEEEFFHAVRMALAGAESEKRSAVAAHQVQRYSWEHLTPLFLDFYLEAARRI